METIYLPDNLNAMVKLEKLSEDDAEIVDINTKRIKIGEIFQISHDHLTFVCAHCAAEFPLFIQFASHTEKHLQTIYSSSNHSAAKTFSADGYLQSDSIEPLITQKYESDSDEETHNFEFTICDGEQNEANESDLDQPSSTQNGAQDGNITAEDIPSHNQIKIENITNTINIIETANGARNVQPKNVRSRKNAAIMIKNIKTFECFECHREFKTTNSKRCCKAHIRCHLAAYKKCIYCTRPALAGKPIECFFCHELFSQLGQYSEHGSIFHKLTDEQLKLLRQMCKRCSMEFKCKNSDAKQMEVNQMVQRYNELNHKCKLCGKVYRRPDIFRRHMEQHEGSTKNFTCEICNKSYAIAYKWGHMRSHTNTRKKQCTVCGALYRTMYGLNMHMMMHTGEKPYHCKYCQKYFRTKSFLNAHVRLHTGDFIHYCKPCKKGYIDVNGLHKHNLKIHGTVSKNISK